MGERPQTGRHSEEPKRIVSDSSSFEIFSPATSRLVSIIIGPENTVTTRVELLKDRQEQRLLAEVQFTEISRNLINAMIEDKAAKMARGSEDVPTELSVISYGQLFDTSVRVLADLGLSNQQVSRLIRTQGQMFTAGADRIGIMPTIVREQVETLGQRVGQIYLDKAREDRQSRLPNRRS